jgi:GntR family transcriptional regulator
MGSPVADSRWRSDTPIYLQVRERIAELILDDVLRPDDPLPSVREVAAQQQVNPLTVLKGYQLLVEEQIVESRRGRGMFVMPGARETLMKLQRKAFLEREWPLIRAKVERLELDWDELLAAAKTSRKKT